MTEKDRELAEIVQAKDRKLALAQQQLRPQVTIILNRCITQYGSTVYIGIAMVYSH